MKRLLSVLFWSVVAAAFIGPGTITTCATAGARFHHALLWALVFSTLGCLVLQEAAARVTVVSGKDLAQALGRRSSTAGARALSLLLVVGAIVLGCAAYQAGNILGAVAGAALDTGYSRPTLTVAISLLAFVLLWLGSAGVVARAMGAIVALMGAAFLITAIRLEPPAGELLRGALLPALPPASGLLVVGLVGTTIVPYNLFLGSGLARGQPLGELRLGLAVAVLLGGAISMAVVVVGGALESSFSFHGLAATLAERLGGWAGRLFAFGLFCAGFSSAVTAPLAAAITARGLFSIEGDDRWADSGWRYRAVWIFVLFTGLAFGVSNTPPVPVILLAQALNGLLLPIVAAYLLLIVNDRAVMGRRVNRLGSNLAMGSTFVVTVLLGTSNLLRAVAAALQLPAPGERFLLLAAAVPALAVGVPLLLAARRRRHAVS